MPTTTTIAAGSSASIALAAGSALRLTGSGVAQLGPTSVPVQDTAPRPISAGWSAFGPYTVAVTVFVTATGAVQYYVASQSDINDASGAQALTSAQAAAVPYTVALGPDSNANSTAIEAAIASGLPIRLTGTGNKQVARSIVLPSNAYVSIAPDCFPQLPTNAHFALWRNRDAQNAIPATNITISNFVATFIEAGHNKTVGQTIWIEGATGNTTLNGAMVVTAVTTGGWSIAVASNAALTNDVHTRIMVSVYNPIAGANFTRSNNVVTVLDSKIRNPKDRVYVTGSISGANSFKGMQTVLSTVPGVSWTYANTGANETATGTANVLGDTNIVFDDFQYDGNKANQSGVDQWLDFPFQFVNVGNCRVRTRIIRNTLWRGMGFWNAGEIDIPYAAFFNGNVGLQFDSGCDGIRVGRVVGSTMTDDVLAWGVTTQTGTFGETACPSGQANMGSLTVDEIDGDSPTGLFKHYCASGYDIGSMRIRRIKGSGRGIASDSTPGVSGGTCTSLVVDSFEATPDVAGHNGVAIGAGIASYKRVEIANIIDNYSGNATTFMVRVDCPVEELVLPNFYSATYGAATSAYATIQLDSGSDVKLLHMADAYLTAGQNLSTQSCINVASGGRLRHLKLDAPRCFGFGGYNTSNYYGNVINEASGGRIDKITINAPNFPDGQLNSLMSLAGGSTTTEIEINGLTQGYADDTTRGRMASVVNDGSSAKSLLITVNGLRVRAIPNNVFQFSGSGTNYIRGRGFDVVAGKFALLTSGTHSTRINCPEVAIDLGASGASPPARLAPVAGDQVRNSNATGPGLYCYKATAIAGWNLVTGTAE